MTYLIKKWFLPDEIKSDYEIDLFDNLSKVNIFIGPNNTGKSRMMRALLRLVTENILPSDLDLEIINNEFSNYASNISEIFSGCRISEYGNLKEKIDNSKKLTYIETRKRFKEDIYNQYKKLINTSPDQAISGFGRDTSDQIKQLIFNSIRKANSTFLDSVNNMTKDYVQNEYRFKKIYIPTLRGLRPFHQQIPDEYHERTKDDYFKSIENNILDVFSGLEMYKKISDLWNGDFEERNLKADYENFLRKYFFENQNIELIPRRNSDVLFVRIGNESEYPIFDLGDGIQQIIIMTFPLFINKNEDVLVFIEEPELYLHPGLQRRFLELLASDTFGNLQTFITTHSNHFLDLTMDFEQVSIYKFQKIIDETESDPVKAKFQVINTSNEDRKLLEILGVKNSSVLLTNCTIWVEGITDRLYIRKYLDIYQKTLENSKIYEEDKHFSFVEYSGNNITHWSFLDDNNESIDLPPI